MSQIRIAEIYVHDLAAGTLEYLNNGRYKVTYYSHYNGPPISLTMPRTQLVYEFEDFPSFFEGLLPEGPQLEALLKRGKLDRNDYFGQLMRVGKDLVGAVSVKELKSHD